MVGVTEVIEIFVGIVAGENVGCCFGWRGGRVGSMLDQVLKGSREPCEGTA